MEEIGGDKLSRYKQYTFRNTDVLVADTCHTEGKRTAGGVQHGLYDFISLTEYRTL